MCFSDSQTCSYTKWELVWMTSYSMLIGLSVMDVSEESKFLFITVSVKALSLLQGQMVSYSVRLQVVICNWALSSWDSNRDRKWSTTLLLLHISCGCMDKMYFQTVTYKNVWSTRNLPMVFFPRVWKQRKGSFLWTVQIVSIYRKF